MSEAASGGAVPSAAPEMARPFPVARIGAGTRTVVEASPEECRALAARMGLVAIHSLTCRFDLKRIGADIIQAEGKLRARVRQTCVVTLEEFDADVMEGFSVRFVPRGAETEELDLESDDEVAYDGGLLELGEAASEQLALALDPFPRLPGAELPGAAPELESGAFAGLSKLLPPN